MRRIILFSLLLAPAFIQAQIDSINLLKPAAVKAVTSEDRSPFTYSEMTEEDIQKRDAAQDMPFLLRFTPSMVVTSDAGNGIGYTNLRLRGTDATRINVTINGVPLNDAESMGVWWVDLPDLASSVSDLQIHRGVGTSTNGPSAFGGSIAINTLGKKKVESLNATMGYGSFNSRRATASWSSGIIGDGWAFEGRYSNISSDGYVDRATSELISMYGSLSKSFENSKVTLTMMDGEERTYQAWYGVPEFATSDTLTDQQFLELAEATYGEDTARVNDLVANGRQHNYYNYENEVDDYKQTHHQLHFETNLGKTQIGAALFQTLGAGYYEQFKADDAYSNYGIEGLVDEAGDTITSSDIIRRRWLDNTLRGGLLNGSVKVGGVDLDFGGMYSQYQGDHFGKIISANVDTVANGSRFYESMGYKNDASSYARATMYGFDNKLRIQAEAQIRHVQYSSEGLNYDDYEGLSEFSIGDTLTFFNPKFGLDYLPSTNSRIYASMAIANREPSRSNYLDAADPSAVLPEELMDLELGFKVGKENWAFEVGAYHMAYNNQLIPTGSISDVGAVVKENVENSYRKGIELQAGFQILDHVRWETNFTYSKNKIQDYVEVQGSHHRIIEESDIAFSPNMIGASIVTLDVWDGKSMFSDEALDLDVEFASKYVGSQYLDNTSNEDKMLDSYLVHDVVLRTSTMVGENEVSLNLFVNNVFNEMYSANGWSYSYLNNEPENAQEWDLTNVNYVYPQAGRNGFASLSVRF